MSQLHFFYGTNTYGLNAEKARWIKEFRAKHGETNLIVFDGTKVSFKELEEAGSMAPFAADKRLLVVSDLPRGQKGGIAALQNALHPAVLVLFLRQTDTDYKPKLTIPGKELLATANCKTFPTVSGVVLQKWLDQEAKITNCNLPPTSRDYLINKVGADQQLLAQELDKLALYCLGEAVTAQDIDALTVVAAEREVWHVLDLIGKKDSLAALNYVEQLLNQGSSPQALWSTLLWMSSGLTHMKALLEAGNTNPFSIAGTIRMAPSSVKSLLPMVRSLPLSKLEALVNMMTEADRRLKTGEYKTSRESEVELLAVLDATLLALA